MADNELFPDLAISVRQPWAWAILHAGKDIENRSRAISWGGIPPRRMAIHAAKGMTRDEYEDAAHFMKSIGVECPLAYDLLRGGIIGSVVVHRFVSNHTSRWFFGPIGMVLRDPVPAVEPVPCAGALGWFAWRKQEKLPAMDAPKPWMLKGAAP